MQKLHEIRSEVRKNRPLIHCITNPISINQCANGILAVGARPMMAEHPSEVREITETADALMLNLGNITDIRMESMMISLTAAHENRIPIILDAVGIACSALRRNYLNKLLGIAIPTVIKGNYSEIAALAQSSYRSAGVDADGTLDAPSVSRIANDLAAQHSCVILASGKTDIITDSRRTVYIQNGTPQLASITGTGCMLGALCGAYLSAAGGLDAAVCACSVLGICGQLAETDKGSGSFLVNLLDALSTLTDAQIDTMLLMEEFHLEKI